MSESTTKSTLKWIVGMQAIFIGAIALGQKGLVSAMFLIVGGAICLPPIIRAIESKINFPVKSWHKYIAVIGLFAIGYYTWPRNALNYVANADKKANGIEVVDPKKEAEQLTAQLQKEISEFDKPFDNSKYRGSTDAVKNEVIVFGAWAQIINNGLASMSPENKSLADKLKSKVVALQVKEFPLMRKEIAKEMSTTLWEHNIEVKCFGKGNTTLDFIGGTYASNKNIKDTQIALSDVTKMYRFKRTQFRWIPSEEKYTYYEIDSPNDSELVTF